MRTTSPPTRRCAEKFPFKPKTIPAKHWAEEPIQSAREPEESDWAGLLSDRGII